MRATLDVAAMAKAWQHKCIVAGDLKYLEAEALKVQSLGDRGDEDTFYYPEASAYIPAEEGFTLIRKAANHYPHPVNDALLDAAIRLVQPELSRWTSGGTEVEALPIYLVEDIIKQMLEEPDALLG